ncbi:MAG: MFS transporter, partial [Alphaproteobacteria bacterium]|nr:MFS transporter [Alphaproteobacteria bacterium]
SLPAGWLGDRFGARTMLVLYFVGTGTGAALVGLAPSPFWISAGLGVMGLFASIYHPVGFGWLIRHATKRGRALGYNAVAGSLGMASAPLIAGWLTHYVDWRAAFFVPGLAIAAVGVVLWLIVPEEAPEAPRGGAARARPELSADAIRLFLVVCCFLIGASTIYNALTIAMPKLFAERVVEGGNVKDVANLVLVVYLVSGAAQLLGGHLVDKLPHKVVLLAGYAMMAPALYVAADSGAATLVVALAVVLAIILGTQPAVDAIVAHHAPPEWRSTAYGIRFVISLSASSASVPLVGEVYDLTGSFTWIFVFLSGLAAFVLVAGLFLPRAAAETRARPQAAE